jgi:HEAT repeat protein
MKSVKIALGLFLLISVLGAGWSFAQPKIPKEKIQADIPEAVKKEIEKLYSKDPVQRGNGCLNLGKMGAKASTAVPFLAGMLGDSANVRRTRTIMQGDMLISAQFDLSVSIGEIAGETLAKMGDPGFIALIAALKDKNSTVRASAASGLGEGKDHRAVEPLILALADKSDIVRYRAATALGKIGDVRAIESLLAVLKDKSASVRRASASSLGQFQDNRATEPLIRCLGDADSTVRTSAAESLGKLKVKEALKPLISALIKDKDPKVRSAASTALGNLEDNQAIEPLISALKDKDPVVRRVTASSLGEFKDLKIVPPLIEALQDKELGNNAVFALKRITGKDFGEDASKWQKWWKENQGNNTKH